jgi:5-methylcytosine-specific restriction endonuclease McrA
MHFITKKIQLLSSVAILSVQLGSNMFQIDASIQLRNSDSGEKKISADELVKKYQTSIGDLRQKIETCKADMEDFTQDKTWFNSFLLKWKWYNVKRNIKKWNSLDQKIQEGNFETSWKFGGYITRESMLSKSLGDGKNTLEKCKKLEERNNVSQTQDDTKTETETEEEKKLKAETKAYLDDKAEYEAYLDDKAEYEAYVAEEASFAFKAAELKPFAAKDEETKFKKQEFKEFGDKASYEAKHKPFVAPW